ELPRAANAPGQVPADGLGLGPAKLPGQVRGQERGDLRAIELAGALEGHELLLEPQASPVQKRLHGALRDLHRLPDLPVAEALELAQREDEPVLLRQPLGHLPDLAAELGVLLLDDWIEAVGGRGETDERLAVAGV